MIEAIKQIGDVIRKKSSDDEYQALCEDPNANGKYQNIICIVFKQEGEKTIYSEIDKIEYQHCNIFKYCFREGSSRGTNCSPSAKITEVKKTFQIKILAWFKKILKEYTNRFEPEEANWLQQIYDELQTNRELILESMQKMITDTPKKEGSLFLTIRFDDVGEKKDLGDYPLFRKILQWESSMDDDVSMSQNQICSLCSKKTTVCGNVSTYTFYNIDKPGFIIGGFKEEDAWKNYPVCSECAKSIEKGKNYIENHLAYRFTSLPFYLIPKILSRNQENLDQVLYLLEEDPEKKIHKLSTSDQSMRSITNDEKFILEAIGGSKDQSYPLVVFVSFHLLFLKNAQSAERIILHLEDILPSRISSILTRIDEVSKLFKKSFTFFDLRTFFDKSDKKNKDNDLDKYYLEIIEKIFKGNPININWLLEFLMKKIREDFSSEEGKYFHATFIRALMSIQFLNKLLLIDMKEEIMEKGEMESVFEKYNRTFQTPSKRGLFLLGTLTDILLRKQDKIRKAKPFMKQLKGLKMNEGEFKGLLPKVQNKLEEYGSFDEGERILSEEITRYLLSAGDNWGLTMNEMNFYFSGGMNLSKEVAYKLYSKVKFDEIFKEEENGSN